MRTSAGWAKTAYVDRGGTLRPFGYALAAIAPRAATTLWTYTVPTGKTAILLRVALNSFRDAVAATPGVCSIIVQQPSVAIMFAARELSNTLGATQSRIVGTEVPLVAATVINSLHADASTGGTFAIDSSADLWEFTL